MIFLIDGITFSTETLYMSCIIDFDTETDDPAASRPVSFESFADPSVLSSNDASMSVPPSEAPPSLPNTSFGPIHPRRVALQ